MDVNLFDSASMPLEKIKEASFYPYEDNNGNVACIVGKDFAVIASDTRLSAGFNIYTRNQPKLFKLSDKTIVGITGCWCDTLTFIRILETRFKMYQHEHNKEMSTTAVSQLVSSLLYYKRFFPYYITIIVAGLDKDGKGRCYHYDPVGHKDECTYAAAGSSVCLTQPLMDNQIGFKNMINIPKDPVTLEKAIAILQDAFISAAERDICTGDGVLIKVITNDGISEVSYPLRRD